MVVSVRGMRLQRVIGRHVNEVFVTCTGIKIPTALKEIRIDGVIAGAVSHYLLVNKVKAVPKIIGPGK